jgi:hypothetical protein
VACTVKLNSGVIGSTQGPVLLIEKGCFECDAASFQCAAKTLRVGFLCYLSYGCLPLYFDPGSIGSQG